MKARPAFVSFVLAWALFCLCFAAGYALLLLSSLAMHGAQPWYDLSQGGAIGALLGGTLGLLRTRRERHARIVWILWSVFGLLTSLCVDHEGLSRRHEAAPLLPPALMLAASIGGLLVLGRSVRPPERPSRD